jgi:hypothetical protein
VIPRRASLASALFLASLAALSAVPARAGSVTGKVIDRSTARPVGGVEVLLVRPGTSAPVARAAADAEGRFTIRGVPAGDYALGASYLGVPYVRRDVNVQEGRRVTEADLDVFQTTTSPEAIRLDADHLLIEPDKDGAGVVEVMVFVNTGARTYLGEASPASPTGHRLAVPIPQGYTELDAPEGLREQIVNRREAAFDLALPLPPGSTQIVFSYRLPRALFGVRLDRRFSFLAQNVYVIVPESGGWRVRSKDLPASRNVSLEGRPFRVTTGGPFAPGRVVSASVASGVLGTGLTPARVAWALGGLVIGALGLAWILRQGRAPRAASGMVTG